MRRTLWFCVLGAGFAIVLQGAAQEPSLVLEDGGIQFPDGTVQATAPSVTASDGPVDLYVDAVTGDDANDGLSAALPKKTIMGAVVAAPSVLNGNVTIRIAPGTYKEEVVLSRRQRNGLFFVLLQQNTATPDSDLPSVILVPPDPPCDICLKVGILTMDELVRIVGLKVDGFDFIDEEGVGILASGSTNLTLANVIVSNNHIGLNSTDGHYVDIGAACRVENNDIGLLSSDHGSIEIDAPVDFCGNTVASLRSERNSSIVIFGDPASCVFCVGDSPLRVSTYSSIRSAPCTNMPACTLETPGAGLCPADFP